MILNATLVLVLAAIGPAGATSNVSLPTFRLPKVIPLKKADPKEADRTPAPVARARADLQKGAAHVKRLQAAVDELSAKIDEPARTEEEKARKVKLLDQRSALLVELREGELRLERLKATCQAVEQLFPK